MKLVDNTITFESEAQAKRALSDLEWIAKAREVGREVREGFASMSQD